MKCDCIAVLENTDNSITTMENCTHLSVWLRDWSVGKGWHAAESVPFRLKGATRLPRCATSCGNWPACCLQIQPLPGPASQAWHITSSAAWVFACASLMPLRPIFSTPLPAKYSLPPRARRRFPQRPRPQMRPACTASILWKFMAAHPDITSKKALRPFLASTALCGA